MLDVVDKEAPDACEAGCPGCTAGQKNGRAEGGSLSGRRLAATAFAVFLVPLIFALAASMLAGGNPEARAIAAAGGFVAGVAAVTIVGRLIARRGKEAA